MLDLKCKRRACGSTNMRAMIPAVLDVPQAMFTAPSRKALASPEVMLRLNRGGTTFYCADCGWIPLSAGKEKKR